MAPCRNCSFMHDIVPNRIVIYAKDITNITGKKERTARKIISEIRSKFHKKPGDLITIYEFCEFTGLKEDRIKQFLTA